MKYGLWCPKTRDWVREEGDKITTYSTIIDAKRDIKKSFVCQDYEVKKVKNNDI